MPDWMNSAFNQYFWQIVGANVVTACLHMLNSCSLPPGLNDTTTVLILKKNISKKVTDIHHISLYNVLYKIVAKVLAKKLKNVIEEVIGDPQSDFITGRFISDNVLVASDVSHCLKRKRQGKIGIVALKIGMSKA